MVRSHLGIRRKMPVDSAAKNKNLPENQATYGITPRPFSVSAVGKPFPLATSQSRRKQKIPFGLLG